MCYQMSYTCNVNCMNSDLNRTLLSNGTVQSEFMNFGNRCSIMCDEGKMISDMMVSNVLPDFGQFTVPLIIIGIAFVIVGYIMYRSV